MRPIPNDFPTRGLPLLVCVLAGLVVLASARGYLEPGTPYGDDHSSHIASIWSLAEDFRRGESELYFAGNNLGVPLLLSYPPLATLSVAALGAVFGGPGAATAIFKLSIVLCWALMPLAWYAGGRWLGLDRRTAAVFGLVSLGMVDVDARGLSMRSALHTGLYSQSFGMLLLPMTLGAVFRALGTARDVRLAARAIVLLWLSCLAHAVTGLVALIASALWVAVPLSGTTLTSRTRRLAFLFVPTFALLGFWLAPLLAHGDLVGGIPWKHEVHQGRPIDEVARLLLGGGLFDAGRFPWITLLLVVGVARAWRTAGAALHGWMFGGSVVFLVLFLGPTNLGPAFRALPLQGEINVTRYLIGLHVFGGLFAASGAVGLVDDLLAWLRAGGGRGSRAATAAIVLGALAAFLADRYAFGRGAFRTFDPSQPHYAALVDHVGADPGSRIAADAELGTTTHFYRDLLPALAGRAHLQSFGMTFHSTLATYYAEYFDYSATQCDLFAVGALVGRDGTAPPEAKHHAKTFDDGRHQVYECVRAPGWFELVDLPLSIEGQPKAMRRAVRASLSLYEQRALARLLPPGAAEELRAGAHFVVGARGRIPDGLVAAVERLRDLGGSGPRGRIVRERVGKTRFAATVEIEERPAWLVLKMNAFPYWSATVDDDAVPIAVVAPNHQAIEVPVGRHEVRFEYRHPAWSKALAAFSILIVLALAATACRRPTSHGAPR